MDENKKSLFQYDPEADVLSWEITGRPIEYAKEAGNVIIHFSKNHSPVLIEILEATKLLPSALGVLEKIGISPPKPMSALRSERTNYELRIMN